MTPQTLTAERRERFEGIISDWIAQTPAITDVTGNDDVLESEISKVSKLLAEASLSRSERATDEQPAEYATKVLESYSKVNEPDKVLEWLKMSQFPGAKKAERVDNILSYCAVALKRTTTSKEWEQFAKWIDDRQQKDGQMVEVFVKWLLGQKNYDPQFWPVKKMQEFWPQAFSGEVTHKTTVQLDSTGKPETY